MINANFRTYDYFTFGEEDGYGQSTLSQDPKGKVKMSISISSQAIQDNILYKDCSYVGITRDANIDDSYVIQFGEDKLKVLYITPTTRFKLVFLKRM